MENFSATLMRAGQAFQVTFSSCRGISPPIHQEFKRPDKPKMLSGPSRTHHSEPAASWGLVWAALPQIQVFWWKHIMCLCTKQRNSQLGTTRGTTESLQLVSDRQGSSHSWSPPASSWVCWCYNISGDNSYTGTFRFQDQPILPTKASSKWGSGEMWP